MELLLAGLKGAAARRLPTLSERNFLFATGIECSYPKIRQGQLRIDQLEACKHYQYWRQDLQLVRDMGLRVLRYGLPYYRIHQGPGRFDWRFADEVMAEIQKLGIIPILDLLHFGLPDWLGDFQNPELPFHFADYAEAVARRYPWVRFYTPVNEIYVTASFSAQHGLWNEQLKSDRAFVTALKHLTAACILASHRIAGIKHNAVMVQSESAERTHYALAELGAQDELRAKLRFLSFDLLYGGWPDGDVSLYLLDNGMSRAELEWFMRREAAGYQVMGNDYYQYNEKIVLPNHQLLRGQPVMGWYQITREYYIRYRKPLMHTETNVYVEQDAPRWLWSQWINVLQMRADGISVIGFTWYSLTDQVDWDIELKEQVGRVLPCGLFDLERRPRPVAAAYRQLLHEFGQTTVVPHAELFELSQEEAHLKVKI